MIQFTPSFSIIEEFGTLNPFALHHTISNDIFLYGINLMAYFIMQSWKVKIISVHNVVLIQAIYAKREELELRAEQARQDGQKPMQKEGLPKAKKLEEITSAQSYYIWNI